jgi:PAS domain S-box-containing protein
MAKGELGHHPVMGTTAKDRARHSLGLLSLGIILLVACCHAAFGAPIRAASELDYPPFALVTEDGQADGFAVQLMRAAATAMGREVNFRVGAWHRIKQDLAAGHLDALPLVARTAEREKIFDFTFPYLSMHGAIVVRRGDRRIQGVQDLADKRVLVMRGDIAEEYVREKGLSDHLITTVSLEGALRLLAEGQGDAMVVQGLAGRKLIRELQLPLDIVGDPLPHFQDFCFAVRAGDEALLADLNEGLALVIADGTFQRLRAEWLGPLTEPPPLPWAQIAGVAAFTLLLALAIGWIWQRTLVQQVNRRTQQLNAANQQLTEEIYEREAVEADLQRYKEQLESQVAARTAELGERTERYELVLAGAQDAIWDWDVKAHRVHFSAQWKALRGLGEEEVSDSETEWSDRIHPDDRPRVRAALEAHFNGKTPYFAEEYRIRRADGSWIWVFDRGLAQRDSQGDVVRMAGSEHDITERRQAEAALQAKEQYYRLLVEQAVDGIFVSDSEGRCLDANTAGAQMLGYTREEILGIRIADLLDPVEVPRIAGEIERLAGGDIVRSEWLFKRKDGSRFPGEAVSRQLPDGRLQAFVRDVTERRKTEEALRRADRQKDEFIALLAHELRNPLAPIRNAVEIFKLSGSLDSPMRKACEMIDRQVTYLVRLIDDLLDVSRVTRGKLNLKRERVEIGELLRQVETVMRPKLEASGHAFHVALPDEAYYLDADPVRLSQVFVNLLNNADSYTPGDGRVDMRVDHEDSTIEVRISDTGIGFSPENMDRMFEPFTQIHTGLDTGAGGLGVGLALASRLVELHEGRIFAHSDGPGRGSEFIVQLPAETTETLPKPATEPPDTVTHIPPRSILLVDDDPDILDSLALLLRINGHRVETASNGLEAVETAERLRPEAILLDVGLPKIDGYEACRRIRQKPWADRVLIVALTGWGQEEDRRKSRQAGFDHHLVKPINLSAINQLLAQTQTSMTSDV